jgi:hypothetical protein
MSIDRHQSVRRQSGYIVPITRDDERVNIPRPELAAMMDPDDAKIDHTADLGHLTGERPVLGASHKSSLGPDT